MRIVWVGLFPPEVRSVGDHCQTLAIQKWFKDCFPNTEVLRFYRSEVNACLKTVEDDDLVFIHSSGDFGSFYWGDKWECWHQTRRKIISKLPNNRIVHLPVTVFYHGTVGKRLLIEDTDFYGGRKNIVLMCREPESHKILANNLDCKTLFVPDFVFYLNPVLKRKRRKGALLVLRKDGETQFKQKRIESILRVTKPKPLGKLIHNRITRRLLSVSTFRYPFRVENAIEKMVQSVIPNVTVNDVQVSSCILTDEVREDYINKVFEYYSSFEVVITDRMHGMIFSVITKTPCVALDDAIPHKISGYKTLLANSVKFVDNIQEIPKAIVTALSKPYEETNLTSHFTGLKEKLFDMFDDVETVKKDSRIVRSDDLLKLIKSRRSIRSWLDKPVEEEKIEKILTAGIYAPTACNYQATRFCVIQDKLLIAKMCKNTSSWFKYIYPNKIIAVLFDTTKPHPLSLDLLKAHYGWSRFIWQDTSVAMMNMMLMAEALGLKTCWVSIIPPDFGDQEKKIRKLLDIPRNYVLTCLLFLGYSDKEVDINKFKHQGLPIMRNEKDFLLGFK